MIQGLYPMFQEWHKVGTVFIYSDPHFGDKELAGVTNRISDEEQLARINAAMGKHDTFICLGDVGDVSFISKIRAKRKILICGNHDAGASNYKRDIVYSYFDTSCCSKQEAYSHMKEKHPDYSISCNEMPGMDLWIATADNHLFDEVFEGPLMIGEKILLSHEPVDITWAVNLHGHSHGDKYHPDKYHYNFCSDVINYTPVNFNQFMKTGPTSKIESLHRVTINKATKRKRGKKNV